MTEAFDGTCTPSPAAPLTVTQVGGVTVLTNESGEGFYFDQEGNRQEIGGRRTRGAGGRADGARSGESPMVVNNVNFYGDTYGVEDLEDRVLAIVVDGGRNGAIDTAS